MPFVPHRRLTFRGVFGTLANPYEEWTFRLNDVGIAGASDDLAAIAQVASQRFSETAAQTGGIRSIIRTHAVLTEVKCADIGADGKYTRDPGLAFVNIAGQSTGGAVQAPQVALAVSLVTARRGPSGRGRFYLPAPAFAVVPETGRISIPDADEASAKAAAFVKDLGNIPGMGKMAVTSSKGFSSVVTAVRVGRVMDTIRSRRTSIAEDYAAPDVVA